MADSGPKQTPGASLDGEPGPVRDPEVVPRARRRTHPAQYKLRILREVEGCKEPGQAGEILRREGLYSSHLSNWRKERDEGALQALGKGRGREGKSAADVEKERLRADNARMQRRLEQLEAVVDVQKKCLLMLGLEEQPRRGGS